MIEPPPAEAGGFWFLLLARPFRVPSSGLVHAASCEKDANVLAQLARQSLPEPLPPEALPWRDRLIQVWEQYPADATWEKTVRLGALVRWLREARRALDLVLQNLAALAGWQPRPGDGPPHRGKAEAAQAWVRFWEKLYQHPGSQPDGLFAAPPCSIWLPSGLSPMPVRAIDRRPVPSRPNSCPPHSGMRQPENPGCPALMLSSTHEQNARDLGFRAASPLPKVSATGTGLHR